MQITRNMRHLFETTLLTKENPVKQEKKPF